MHKNEQEIITQALNIAKKSTMRSKHGCVIVDNKGNTISTGFNKEIFLYKREHHTYYDKFEKNKSVHAEVNAIRNVDPAKLNGAKLYVVRWGSHESNPLVMNSKPCKRCASVIERCIKKYGLKYAYYSSDLDYCVPVEI